MAYDSTYSAYASIAGGSGYDSTYSAMKAAAVALGAEDKNYDSEYSIAVELATLAENGEIGGGGSGSSESGELISDKELIEEALRSDNEKKYCAEYGYIYEYGEMIPYLSNYGVVEGLSDGVFPEVVYNLTNGGVERAKDENDQILGVIYPITYTQKYMPKITTGDYFWDNVKKGIAPAKGGYNNKVFRAVIQNFGYTFNNSESYDSYIQYIEDSYVKLLRDKSTETITYSDYIDEGIGVIQGKQLALYSGYGYGKTMPDKDSKKWVYDSSSPIAIWQSYGEPTNVGKLLNIQNAPLQNINFETSQNSFMSRFSMPIALECTFSRSRDNYCKIAPSGLWTSIKITDIKDDYPSRYIEWSFSNCTEVTSIEFVSDKKIGEGMNGTSSMFDNCRKLTSIPELDTSMSGSMYRMFTNCLSLQSIPLLDSSSVWNSSALLIGSDELTNLTDIGGFKDLKVSWPAYFLDKVPNATAESLMNVINNLWDWTGNTTGKLIMPDGTERSFGTTHTMKFGTTNLAKLTEDEIAVATAKGWILT